MEFQREPGRIWLVNNRGQTIAEVLFPEEGDGIVNMTHTFVDDSLRGQGIAGQLMEAAAEQLRREGKKARLSCSYAVSWFPAHPEFHDVLA